VLRQARLPAEAGDTILLALRGRPLPVEPFDDVERALLVYAEKLTLTPGRITAEDIAALRAAGLDDRAIHDACAIVAYFAFVNRVADGLGVELET
jgi:uncharacterized peroxidase-related enzyme